MVPRDPRIGLVILDRILNDIRDGLGGRSELREGEAGEGGGGGEGQEDPIQRIHLLTTRLTNHLGRRRRREEGEGRRRKCVRRRSCTPKACKLEAWGST